MTISMDGVRRSLASAYLKTLEAYKEIIYDRDPRDFEELEEGLTEIRQSFTALFCSYDQEDKLFNDMSSTLEKLPWPNEWDERDDD